MLIPILLASGGIILAGAGVMVGKRLLRPGGESGPDHASDDPIDAAVNDELARRGFTDQPPTGRPRGKDGPG